MNINESIAGIRLSLRSWVHESARGDALSETRHHSFIMSHLFSGLLALSVFPLYLAAVGQPDLMESLAFIWLLSPIGIAAFLSRTGRIEAAHLVSAANLTALVVFVAGLTGGVDSFLLAWLIVVPVEASLSASRRTVAASILLACIALVGLLLAGQWGFLPAPRQFGFNPQALMAFGALSAIIYVGGIAVNVEKLHRETSRAIASGEARYRLLAENASDLITRHSHNGHALFASHASQRLLGVKTQDLLGDGLYERIHILDRPAFLTAISRAYVSGGPVSAECRIRKHSDEGDTPHYIWAEMRCRIAESAAGQNEDNISEVVAVTRDITKRKAQEEALRQARDEAEKANVAKTRFLANVSHELRTPLNAIIGFSDLMNQELVGRLANDQHREYTGLIHESGEHLLQLVNELLDMSKIESGKYDIVRENLGVGEMVASVCQFMQGAVAEKKLHIKQDIAEDLRSLSADRRAFKQILINLLSNAIKFSKPEGQITLSACQRENNIEICIADQGIGITPEDIKRLGQAFVQADNSYDRKYEGSGLGLSIVKGLMHLHDGRMKIESEPGKGTSVTLCFPQNMIETAPLAAISA